MKYPLTETAKTAAIEIVAAWDAGNLEQKVRLAIMRGGDQERPMIVNRPSRDNNFTSPPLATWWELSKFNLVAISADQNWDILLLQELRNAVATDFDVSDYFITMNAVGNIIVNSTTGPVQGVGVNTGTVHQTVEQLADYMTATLGQDFLAANIELKAAIDELRTATTADQQSALGKVISQLGNSLHLGASTATIVQALTAAAPFLQGLIGG